MQPGQSAPCDSAAVAAVQRELMSRVGQRRFEHWFDGKTTLTVSDDRLRVGVGSPFLLNWMQRQFHQPLLEAAQAVLGPSANFRIEVDARLVLDRSTESSAAEGPRSADVLPLRSSAHSVTANHHSKPPESTDAPAASSAGLRTRRLADLADFIVGPSNELAMTAVRQVADCPGAKFNPLYLYGNVGIGKTHLLEGLSRQIRRHHAALNIVQLGAEAFANYFTQALRDKTLPSFRQRFRTVDVLLVDDIDFLDGKRVIQEEFLHTFMELEGHGRQVVVTADRHPRLLTKLSDELVTRFLSGLVCRIEAPDLETRQRIIEHKATRSDAEIATEALHYIAQRFKSNVRELEGALNCLQTLHSMTGKRVTLSAARQVLADLERDCARVVRMSDVEQAVCNLFGVQPKELRSSSRSRALSQPRMLAMYLARKHTQAAYTDIGQYFGGRNHSTVMSAEKKVQSWLDKQSELRINARAWTVDEVLNTLEQQLLAG